jgi:hypothetical protein
VIPHIIEPLTKSDFRNAKNYVIDLQTNVMKKAQFSFPEAMSLDLVKALGITREPTRVNMQAAELQFVRFSYAYCQ